jgi:prepilin-type N-terminal cleavage/methylation domain-containing protein
MKKGFTLIELLVVISIISLLSSIVLASVQDARDKAKGTAFRQNVDQFIKAIELYRLDNKGGIPITINTKWGYSRTYGNGGNNGNPSQINDPDIVMPKMEKYISAMPYPPFDGSGGEFFWGVTTKEHNSSVGRCSGDTTTPKYIIAIRGTKNTKYFEDWDTLAAYPTIYKCFSVY